MQATLNALDVRGSVERVTDAGRGRTARLHVTPEGDRLRAAGRAAVDQVDEDVRAQLDDASYESLTAALSTLLPTPPGRGQRPG